MLSTPPPAPAHPTSLPLTPSPPNPHKLRNQAGPKHLHLNDPAPQNATNGSVAEMGARLAREVSEWLAPFTSSSARRPMASLSFVGHSMGCLITRAALAHPLVGGGEGGGGHRGEGGEGGADAEGRDAQGWGEGDAEGVCILVCVLCTGVVQPAWVWERGVWGCMGEGCVH